MSTGWRKLKVHKTRKFKGLVLFPFGISTDLAAFISLKAVEFLSALAAALDELPESWALWLWWPGDHLPEQAEGPMSEAIV